MGYGSEPGHLASPFPAPQERTWLEPGHTDVTSSRFDDAPSLHAGCETVAPVLARVGDKWSMFIVLLLGDGPVRFNALKRRVHGISQRMLSLTLRNLERDGLVSRTVTPSVPVRVDYALTDLGRALAVHVQALGEWAKANHAAIAAARERYGRPA